MPIFSIIIPIYNSQNHLKDTLNGIQKQTFKDFEVICVDDGSTDDSLKILNRYSVLDYRIKVVSQSNQGAGAARNRGLEESSGEYVCFIDSDDYIVPEYLEKTYENLISNDSDIVFYKIGNILENKKVKLRPYFAFDKKFPNEDFDNFTFTYKQAPLYVLNYHFAPWTKVYKREFLDKYDDFLFDEKLPYEDMVFHAKCMLRASRISFVPQYLYYYRLDNPNSLTSDDKSHKKIFEVVDNMGEFLKSENCLKELEKEYDFYKFIQITRHITYSDENFFKKAKAYLQGIDLQGHPIISEKLKKRYQLVFDSDTLEIYERDIKIRLLEEERENIENKHKKLKDENSKLNKQLKDEKTKNKDLLNSTSWQMTGGFRKISSNNLSGKLNMKEHFLNRSNSYNYYKNNYKKLLKENKSLNKKLKEYKKECPICGYKGVDFKPYPQIIHKEVECPKCRSHERHRALWLYFQQNSQLLKEGNRFLHFAPEVQFQDMFRNSGMEYHPVDISSENWFIDEIVDVQDIPYEDDYFDLIYCSHILEHVPDDRKAIRELYRVLKPGGIALILVPINGVAFELPYDETKTLEDESYNTPELREKYYGQFDHVRLYGSDFSQRLLEGGFNILSDDFIKQLGYETIERYALIRNESIFECTK